MLHAELKKLLHSGPFRIFLGIFLIAGVLSPLSEQYMPDDSGALPADYSAVYQAYEGFSTEEVIADIDQQITLLSICQDFEILAQLPPEVAEMFLESMIEQYGLTEEEMSKLDAGSILRFSDAIHEEIALLNAVKEHAERVASYPAYLGSIQTQVETIRNSILYKNNPYALSLAVNTAAEYRPLLGHTIPLADPMAAQIALGTWVDDSILCAIICLTALFAFAQERQEGMTPLLFSTRNGRTGTYFAKLILTVGIGILASIMLALVRLLIAGDLGDLSRPLQTIPAYYTSPHSISVGELLALSFFQRTVAAILVGLVMSLLCILLERSLALGAVALICGVEVLCWTLIDSNSILQFLKYLSIPALFSDETLLGNAVYIKLFGAPVAFLFGWLALTLIGCTALTAVGCHLYRSIRKTLSIPVRQKKLPNRKKISGLFGLELKKLMIHQKAAILLILVIALQPSFYKTFHSGLNIHELRYMSVLMEVEGAYTPEKHEALRIEQEKLQALQSTAGELMRKELDERLTAVDRVLALSDYLASREEPVSYVYEGGIEALLGLRTVGPAYQFPLMALALCLILPGLFTLERESGMDHLLQTTQGVRRLKRTKWKITFLLTACLFLTCWLPVVIFIFKTFQLSGWTAPAISLRSLSTLPGWVPIWMQAAVVWLRHVLCAAGAAVLVGLISERTGKYIPAVLLSVTVLGGVILFLL